jgi:hypothetical protein
MSQGQGVISSNDLMKKLVQAKKVMNKVDGGNFERGNINETVLRSSPEELLSSTSTPQPRMNTQPMVVDESRVSNSKLPDAIKRAMIENPIPQISLADSLDMDFVKGTKRLMEQEGITKKQPTKTYNQNTPPTSNTSFDMNTLTILIENTVRKVMDEKLNQILTAQQTTSINESLVLKVGDSVFKGTITGVNKSK